MQSLSILQIDEICNAIPINRALPLKVGQSIIERVRTKLRAQLEVVKIYPEIFKKFKDEILYYYHTTMAQAGEAVGIITAQSIGERQTQCTLNAFHSAGLTIRTVVVGVPRFSELLNATKDPKMVNCLIFLNEPFEGIKEIRKRIGNNFTDITMKRLVKTYDLMKGPLEDWHYLFCEIYEIDPTQLGWRVRLILDINVIYEYSIKMKLIKEQIEKSFPTMTVLYKPESKGVLDIFIDEFRNEVEDSDISDRDEVEEELEDEVEDEMEEEVEDEVEIEEEVEEEEIKEKKIELVKENIDDDLEIPYDIKKIITIEDKILPELLNLNICGIIGVKEIFFEKRSNPKEEWVVTTEGSNLYGLFNHPLVDKKRTLSNNMWEIYKVFGIEATRQFLIEEFMDVVSSDGTFVNSSHVELLVDLMVYTGTIISISRYGQKKVGSGPMSKASFEESLENFLKAGLNGEIETTDGVSASIMLGKLPKTGTGVFDLKVDIEAIMRMGKEEEEKKEAIDRELSFIIPSSTSSKKFTKTNSLF